MKVKPRFMIGDWVKVSAYVKFDYPNNIRTPYVQKLEKPIIGQIVGARMKFWVSTYPADMMTQLTLK